MEIEIFTLCDHAQDFNGKTQREKNRKPAIKKRKLKDKVKTDSKYIITIENCEKEKLLQ